jgi:hypothetical protein
MIKNKKKNNNKKDLGSNLKGKNVKGGLNWKK